MIHSGIGPNEKRILAQGVDHMRRPVVGIIGNSHRIENRFPVQAVGKDSAEKGKEHDGQLAQKQIEAEVKGVFGNVEDQPALRKLLHERAYRRRARAQPHQAKVAIAKGPECASKKRWAGGHSWEGPLSGRLVGINRQSTRSILMIHFS